MFTFAKLLNLDLAFQQRKQNKPGEGVACVGTRGQ